MILSQSCPTAYSAIILVFNPYRCSEYNITFANGLICDNFISTYGMFYLFVTVLFGHLSSSYPSHVDLYS